MSDSPSATAASPASNRLLSFPLLVVHAAAIWAFAVAQPLYDVLRRNPEFFIAHRAGLGDLLVFCLLVSALAPAAQAAALAVWTWRRPSWRLATAAAICGLLFAVLASQLVAHRLPLPTAVHGLVAGLTGLAGGWLYFARPTFRSLLTAMSPAIAIFPIVLLLHPSMATFVRTETHDERAAADIPADAPPVVFLVFDQLPLTSIMDSHGGIDRDRYPGFAALADTSTWYRNASTVADFTGWALPPIVTGQRPSPERRPTSDSYPFNLFTWLGARYHIESLEPITQLCPERLCDARRPPLSSRVIGMAADSAVVYLAIVLPEGPRQLLPSLTNDWKNFIKADGWHDRWVAESKTDRRVPPRELIAGISRDDPSPTLYFGHALLPHEPYVYLRSGQQFGETGTMVGIRGRGLWSPDPWPVTLAYTRHLMQVEFVDAIVARMLDRLKAEGLLERALIVVTSDHGVSFRPGLPFRGLERETIVDMAAVPLFIKAPGQTIGRVSDRNVQSVDVMPTVASLLGVPLTWTPDGLDAGSSAPAPADKRLHHTGASKSMDIESTWLAAEREKAVARKVSLFGEAPGWRAPAPGDRQLLGRSISELRIQEEGDAVALVQAPQRFRTIAADASALPVAIEGRLRDGRGNTRPGHLAIAIGGRIVALTRTFDGRDAPRDWWHAILDPSALVPGVNTLDVFVIPDAQEAPLIRAFTSGRRPDSLNLASRGAAEFFEVVQEGLFAREGEPVPVRWTTGEATIEVPTDDPPRTLRVGILGTRPGGSDLTLTFNDCAIFSGPIEAPWYKVFPLDRCQPSAVESGKARIVLRSPVWQQQGTGRRVGVALETVNLFQHDWPPPERGGADRASIRVIGSADVRPAGSTVRLDVANLGNRTWLPATETTDPQRTVWLALRWRTPGSREVRAEQRVPLPRALYPTDRIVIEAGLVPPANARQGEPWEVTIAPVDHVGALVAEDAKVVVSVAPRAAP